MHSQAELRDGLIELAEAARPSAAYEVEVLRRARRIRSRRRAVSVSAAAVCVAVLATMLRLAGVGTTPQLAASPPDGPFLGWETTGNATGGDLVRRASEAWDRGSPSSTPPGSGPHTGVRALLEAQDQLLGAVVVLQGYDERNVPRLAFFTGDASESGALTLRVDWLAPDPATTQVISLVSPRLTGPIGTASDDYWGAFAVAVAAPGVTQLQASSTTIDQVFRQGSGRPNGRFVVQQLPISSTAQTTSITGFVKSKQVFMAEGDGGAIGDAQAVPATVVRRDDQRIIVATDGRGPVQVGQFAVAASGLVGRVAAVDDTTGLATIDLVTSTGFSGAAYTDISNVPGSVRGLGGTVLLEQIPAGEKNEVNEGNRVIMADPSQRSDTAGAVTIGRAARTKPAADSTVELNPAVDLAHLTEVSIMTPPAEGTR